MKSSVLRTIVIGVTLLLVLVIGVQLYWVSKSYKLEEREFNIKVNSALRAVVEGIRNSQNDYTPFAGVVTQPEHNFFIADTKYIPDSEETEFALKKAIEEYDIFTNFKFGIYDTVNHKLTHIRYVSYEEKDPQAGAPLPLIHKPYNYIGILFPNRDRFIIHQMDFWIFSTVCLLVVILGFGISIYQLFRQKRLSEIQKDFINNMTHEFRTPISTIQLSTEFLKKNASIQNSQRLFQYTNIIENEANHLEEQVERVLQVAHMKNHTLHLENQPVNVHEVIAQTVHEFESAIRQKDGHFELDLTAADPVITADRLHFTNILFNLADNAIKYAARPIVTFHTREQKGDLLISIKDNGPGIAAKYQKFLFTKFFRIPTGNLHEVKGFGLGLNYVKLYTKSFRGDVRVESEPGKGCNFILVFPKESKGR